MIFTSASETSLVPMPGATLAVIVTWRWRASRLICDGPVVGTELHDRRERHGLAGLGAAPS
jgi:hypothetical protein